MAADSPQDRALMEAMASLCVPLLRVLGAFEALARRLHPPDIGGLRVVLRPRYEELEGALLAFRRAHEEASQAGLGSLWEQLVQAAEAACRACELFCEAGEEGDALGRVLGSLREHALAQEKLFGLRHVLPPVDAFFLDPDLRAQAGLFDLPLEADTHQGGLHHTQTDRQARGGFSLWIPEAPPEGDFPLVVALHGGSGHGADFLFTWLREVRSRRCLLLAPTSRGGTWAFQGPDVDAPALLSMIDFVAERWPVDRQKILLTGLSDGATYSLYAGTRDDMPFTALAPVSGVLHPAVLTDASRHRLPGLPVYLVHGARDWMFPVDLARAAAEQLRAAGCELVYREIEDLSHTYPREENARILDWFLD